MTLTDLLSIMAGLAGLIAGVGAFLKSRGETRKSDAETRKSDADVKHSAVDTASDALAIVRQVYGDRIEAHEARIAAMEKDAVAFRAGRESDRQTIIDLNRRLGNVMQAAETQSQQIQLLRERVDELLCILRENKIPLPRWANQNECDE